MKALIGRKFNSLLVLECVGVHSPSRYKMYRCECECGKETIVRSSFLRNGHTKSCGCLQKKVGDGTLKHAHAKRNQISATYISWRAMIDRCSNPNRKQWMDYGGRGITVDPTWVGPNGFRNFLRDMGERPIGTTLDRERVNGNYEKGNCRWADWKTQGANKRSNDHLLKVA
jgi:hypothetical protein